MVGDTLKCFTCKRSRLLKYFQDNRRTYQLPHYKGKVASCKQCTRARIFREMKAVRFDFEQQKFVIHYFENKNQARKFWLSEK